MTKLVVAVMGNKHTGKSQTWKTLFQGLNVRTSKKSLKKVVFSDHEYTDVFLINGSPQERKKIVEEIIPPNIDPAIVLCSIQYTKDAVNTLQYFADKGYTIYLHWLNPGYHDTQAYHDHLGIIPQILTLPSLIGQRDGKADEHARVTEIQDYLYDWAKRHGLLKQLKQD